MKKGFTLIELLAVIVILAIIALIATPIILGMINDAREKANERSVELYASAVRNAIASYQLTNPNAPTSFEDLNVEKDGDVECATEELYEDGSFYLEGCTVNDSEKEYSYGKERVCTVAKQVSNKYSVGDVVTCTLEETTDKFYVIEEQHLNASTIKMLTDKLIDKTQYRQGYGDYVAFSSTNYWSSVTTYQADVYDERNDIIKPVVDEYVKYLNTKIPTATGSLLTYNQMEKLGCSDLNGYTYNSCAHLPQWVYSTDYWLGSAASVNEIYRMAWGGDWAVFDYSRDDLHGIRPVITISTKEIK